MTITDFMVVEERRIDLVREAATTSRRRQSDRRTRTSKSSNLVARPPLVIARIRRFLLHSRRVSGRHASA